MKGHTIRIWEAALILAIWAGLLTGLWAQKTHSELASEVVRLHVLAKDDTPQEQAVKLAVRDEVLSCLQPILADVSDAREARSLVEANLHRIRAAAQPIAGDRQVAVTLTEEYYPTRHYDTFSLPAGTYTSLRVILAEGAGKNWWCVVYPALCTAPALAPVAEEVLSEETVNIITEQEGYIYKFKLLELWGQLQQRFS